jgi:hypothetical protein
MFNLEQSIADWRRQMIAAGIKTPVPLEELESHLRAEIEQQRKAGSNEQDAFNSAAQKIGPARALTKEFAKAAKTKGNQMIDHNRLYCAVLTIFGVVNGLTTIGLFYWQQTVGWSLGHMPAWSIPWMTAINFAYTVAIVATLLARRYRPEAGLLLTRLLNWALLPALVGGTVLGLYGLWKVDKEKEQYV